MPVIAQEDEDGKKPVFDPWNSSMLIDARTTLIPEKGAFNLIIQHRFGEIKTYEDIFGIYAAANARMALNYSILDNLMVGASTEKNTKFQEFYVQYNIFNQTRSGSFPVTISYYGNMAIDGRAKDVFGEDFKFTNRLSYFNELIVSRKFTDKLSLEVAANFSHFNKVDSLVQNDATGLSLAGRYKIYGETALMVEYHYANFTKSRQNYQPEPIPGLAIGLELGTSTHGFQVFVSNFDKLSPQLNAARNQRDFFKGKMLVGFNITIRM
ncbi:MAG TPA: hypothetical protein DCQ31_16280 [Bacteroidales bacterium]|nr:hypothetical protein [Bacteroidales bacterium]